MDPSKIDSCRLQQAYKSSNHQDSQSVNDLAWANPRGTQNTQGIQGTCGHTETKQVSTRTTARKAKPHPEPKKLTHD